MDFGPIMIRLEPGAGRPFWPSCTSCATEDTRIFCMTRARYTLIVFLLVPRISAVKRMQERVDAACHFPLDTGASYRYGTEVGGMRANVLPT